MLRRFALLAAVVALATGLVGCGDPGRVTISESSGVDATGAPMSTPLLSAAATDDVSYGTTEGMLGEIGSIRSHPDSGTAPRVLWSQEIGAEAMILHDGVVYAADLAAGVTAIDVATGEIRWQVQPDEGADSSGGVTMSLVEGTLRVFVPYSYAVELDASDGSTRSLESALDENPWPEQAAWYAGDGFDHLEGWEPRVVADDDALVLVGHSPDGAVTFETTGEPMTNPLPYALRSGSTVIIADQSGYVVALDWP